MRVERFTTKAPQEKYKTASTAADRQGQRKGENRLTPFADSTVPPAPQAQQGKPCITTQGAGRELQYMALCTQNPPCKRGDCWKPQLCQVPRCRLNLSPILHLSLVWGLFQSCTLSPALSSWVFISSSQPLPGAWAHRSSHPPSPWAPGLTVRPHS